MSRRLEFRILGPLEVRRDDVPVVIGGPRQRALLALLLCSANRVVSRERLLDELLGDQQPESADRMLRVQISRLRKALTVEDGEARLLARPPGYMLRVEEGELDLTEFERRLAAGRKALESGDPKAAAALLRDAESLWRGQPLADLEFEPFARFEVQRLEELRLLAVEERIEAELSLGRHAALCPRARDAGRGTPAARAPPRPADAGPVPLGTPGRRARGLPRRSLATGRGARARAGAGAAPARARDPRARCRAPTAVRAVHESRRRSARRQPRHRRCAGVLGSAGGAFPRQVEAALVGPGRRRGARGGRRGGDRHRAGGSGSRAGVVAAPNSTAIVDSRTNRVVGAVAVGADPEGVVAGAGDIWVANTSDHTLSDIDPSSRRVTRTLSFPGTVDGVGADGGSLWTLDTLAGVARRVDPAFGTVMSAVPLSPFRGTLHASPTAVAVGGGSAWFADNAAAAVVRVSSGGQIVSTTNVGNHPSAIAIGDGATWVADDLDDTVTRIDADGGVAATIPVGQGASGLAVGDGAVWVADTLDNALVRIDPATDSVTTTIPVGAAPSGVAWGDGSVWVADSGDGTIARVDPRSDRVIATIRVGQSPQSVVVAYGVVWVTVQAQPQVAVAAGSPPGVLRIAREHPFASLDPARVSYLDIGEETQVMYATCAALLTYPDRPGNAGKRLVPDVATALPTVSDGGRTYTYTIRRGFRFSPPSDAPVTAATFAHTIDRVLSHGEQGFERGFFADIVGEPAFNAGKASRLAGVTARGDTLTVRLVAPAPDLPARLAMFTFCAVPDDTPDTPQTRPIPSAGPYYIASSTSSQLVLERNPNYGGHRPRVVRRIVYSFGQSFTRAAAAVAAGQIDYVSSSDLPPNAVAPASLFATLQQRYGPDSKAARTGHQRYFVNPTPTLLYFMLNTTRGPFASTRVRQAVNYAIDRQALVRAAGPIVAGEPISHYLPPAIPGALPGAVYPLGAPDLAKARSLAHGVHAHVTLVTCNTSACVQTAQVLQTDLGRIGITLDVVSLPIDAMAARLATNSGPWDIGWVSWSIDYADPSDYLSGIFDPALLGGVGGFDEHTWIAAIRHADTLTGARRLAVYGRLDDALAREAAPILVWSTQVARDFFSVRVGCQVYQPIFGMDLGRLCLRS